MINDASVVIGGGNWGIKEADVLGYKLINNEYYARDIDFANSTAAGTYTDSTGVVRKAPYNFSQYSEQFDNAVWSKFNSTVTANIATAPNGTLTADKLIEDTALSTHLVLQLPAGSISGNVYTFSFYAKAAERFNVSAVNNAAGGGQATYNLNTGVVTFTSGISASMQLIGDGWYRCILTYSPTVTGNFNTHIRLANSSGANTYQGDGISGAFIWGAQLVEGTEALPYFPTTTRLNVPRIDYRNADGSLSTTGRLLLEPQRTNSIRNSSMVGAVAGTPGILPTNWVMASLAGLTQTVVGTGTENGLPYVDLRFNGTASASSLRFTTDASTAIAALPGQIWSNSSYFKLTSGTLSQITLRNIYRNSGAGAITTPQQQFDLTATLTRRTFTGDAAPDLTAFVQQEVLATLVIGQSYDFTIRIAAPQMELGAYATTWIPTTTAAVTRNADVASRTGVSSWIGQTEGTLFIELSALSLDNSLWRTVGLSDGTSANMINFYFTGTGTSNRMRALVRASSVDYFNEYYIGPTITDTIKVAIAYASNDAAFYVNGTQVAVDSSVIVPACNRLQFAEAATGAPMLGNINQFALFQTRLTNSQLQSLTTL